MVLGSDGATVVLGLLLLHTTATEEGRSQDN